MLLICKSFYWYRRVGKHFTGIFRRSLTCLLATGVFNTFYTFYTFNTHSHTLSIPHFDPLNIISWVHSNSVLLRKCFHMYNHCVVDGDSFRELCIWTITIRNGIRIKLLYIFEVFLHITTAFVPMWNKNIF